MNVDGLRLTDEARPPRGRQDPISADSLSPILDHHPQEFILARSQLQLPVVKRGTSLARVDGEGPGHQDGIRSRRGVAARFEQPPHLRSNHSYLCGFRKPGIGTQVKACSRLTFIAADHQERAGRHASNQRGHVHRVAPAGQHGIDRSLPQDAALVAVPDHLYVKRSQRLPEARGDGNPVR